MTKLNYKALYWVTVTKSQKAFELCNGFALDGAEILNLN